MPRLGSLPALKDASHRKAQQRCKLLAGWLEVRVAKVHAPHKPSIVAHCRHLRREGGWMKVAHHAKRAQALRRARFSHEEHRRQPGKGQRAGRAGPGQGGGRLMIDPMPRLIREHMPLLLRLIREYADAGDIGLINARCVFGAAALAAACDADPFIAATLARLVAERPDVYANMPAELDAARAAAAIDGALSSDRR